MLFLMYLSTRGRGLTTTNSRLDLRWLRQHRYVSVSQLLIFTDAQIVWLATRPSVMIMATPSTTKTTTTYGHCHRGTWDDHLHPAEARQHQPIATPTSHTINTTTMTPTCSPQRNTNHDNNDTHLHKRWRHPSAAKRHDGGHGCGTSTMSTCSTQAWQRRCHPPAALALQLPPLYHLPLMLNTTITCMHTCWRGATTMTPAWSLWLPLYHLLMLTTTRTITTMHIVVSP